MRRPVGGGWGIDALLGRQTRPHRDLDVMHRHEQEPTVVATLAEAGSGESLGWCPARFVVTDAKGRETDLHPLAFASGGSATQSSLDLERPFA
ncbi:nucleotidyltransferase domain-containing protein [Saccharothrix isguenensis]